MHTCDERCRRRPGLTEAHERARKARRARTLAKFKGHRVRVRPIHPNGRSE